MTKPRPAEEFVEALREYGEASANIATAYERGSGAYHERESMTESKAKLIALFNDAYRAGMRRAAEIIDAEREIDPGAAEKFSFHILSAAEKEGL